MARARVRELAFGGLVAGVISWLTVSSLVHGYVFTRTEGEALQKQLALLEEHTRDDVHGLRDDVRELTKAILSKSDQAKLEIRKRVRSRELAQQRLKEVGRSSGSARAKASFGPSFWLRTFDDGGPQSEFVGPKPGLQD